MTRLQSDYAEMTAALAPRRRQTWCNVVTLAAIVTVPLVTVGFVVGVVGGIAWLVGAAIVSALS